MLTSDGTLSRARLATSQRGAALLEGLIAIVIFSLGILAIVGLQATSTQITTQSKARVDASHVANQRIGQIWIDQANIAAYAESNAAVPSLPNGKRTTTIVNNLGINYVTVTVTWQMPGEATSQSFTTVAAVNTNPP